MLENALSINNIWIYFERIENYDDKNSLMRMSILTEEMLENDNDNMKQSLYAGQSEYKPYFMSFIAYSDSGFQKYIGRIGKWSSGHFTDKNTATFQGLIEMSASPIKYKKYSLFINDDDISEEIEKKLNKTYPLGKVKTDSEIETILEKELDGCSINRARVYKVGNANMIQFIGNKSIMFDIGYHSKYGVEETGDRKQYNNAISELKKIVTDMVIISHWDSDHYLGVTYAEKSLLMCPWIVPKVDSNINVRRLYSYIEIVSGYKIFQVDTDSGEKLIYKIRNNKFEMCFYRGSGFGDNNIKNSKGIAIVIKSDDTESIFQADVPYRALQNTAWRRDQMYDYIVVPHHGANTSTKCISGVCGVENGIAIVSGNKSKNRPHKNHAEFLKNKGYNVTITEDADSYVEIELDKKGIYRNM